MSSTLYTFKGVPGKAEVELVPFDPANPVDQQHPEMTLRGHSITEWRKRWGGDEKIITHVATGDPFPVSLKQFAGRDPDKTHIAIVYRFHPKQPIAPEHQHLFPPPPPKK